MINKIIFKLVLFTGAFVLLFSSAMSAKYRSKKDFKVYWNVPTFMCHKYGLNFNKVSTKYGIIQNNEDKFIGEQVALLYDPGLFPAIEKSANGLRKYRNGGLPQSGSLRKHLQLFRNQLEKKVPQGFSGIGVIDFESWYPILKQNWGNHQIYHRRTISVEYNGRSSKTVTQLESDFESIARNYMEQTIAEAKRLRPEASWSYYGYPYCKNMRGKESRDSDCVSEIKKGNDKLSWLWEIEDNFTPSIYFNHAQSKNENYIKGLIKGRLDEAHRLAESNDISPKILPYWRFKYYDDTDKYLTKRDVAASFNAIVTGKTNGFIIWGSSKDVNTRRKCNALDKFLTNILGPELIRINKYGQRSHSRPTDDTDDYESNENEDDYSENEENDYSEEEYDNDDNEYETNHKERNKDHNESEEDYIKSKEHDDEDYIEPA